MYYNKAIIRVTKIVSRIHSCVQNPTNTALGHTSIVLIKVNLQNMSSTYTTINASIYQAVYVKT